MRKIFFAALLLCTGNLFAQDAIKYQTPPKEIYDLVMAKPTPGINFDNKGNWMLIMERSSMPTVEELAQPELRIAGLRINPNNFSPSRSGFSTAISLKNIKTGVETPVTGLPADLKAGSFSWSPNEDKIAFTNTTNTGVDLYIINIQTKKATKINKAQVNTVMGSAFNWIDNNTIVYKSVYKQIGRAHV